jgi:glutathione synthase/RimK-type ligase-like ATP-grasp enzyme
MRNAGHVDTSVDPRAPVLVELSGDERTIVARAARAAGLPFTGLDLQRPRDGGPAQVLECNAAPMFANFCRRTGADVAGPLADLLVRLARGGEVWKEES